MSSVFSDGTTVARIRSSRCTAIRTLDFDVPFGEMGDYLAFLGQSNEAIEVCRLALRLNPRDPSNFWRHSSIATAHFVAADYGDALEEGKRVARWDPGFLRGGIV
jgi:hypothetical protein